MSRSFLLALLYAALGAAATAAETTEPAKDTQQPKDTKESKETPEQPSLPPWTTKDWFRTSNLVQLQTISRPQSTSTTQVEALLLDALREKGGWVAAFHRYPAYVDPHVSAQFLVESAGTGSRAVGVIVGSTDSANYLALEITRTDLTLYRAQAGKERVVLGNRGGLSRPDNAWYTIAIDCKGQLIRAYYGSNVLFTAMVRDLKPGLVGTYAAQGRSTVILTYTGRPTRLAVPWEMREMPPKSEDKKEATETKEK